MRMSLPILSRLEVEKLLTCYKKKFEGAKIKKYGRKRKGEKIDSPLEKSIFLFAILESEHAST